MRSRAVFLLGIALFLSACADDYWPGQNAKDGALSASDYPVVEKRYETASKITLGTTQDIEEIRRVLRISHPEMEISEIRWISATEVIAYTERNKNENLGYESFYCAIEKNDKGWRFVACYLYLIA